MKRIKNRSVTDGRCEPIKEVPLEGSSHHGCPATDQADYMRSGRDSQRILHGFKKSDIPNILSVFRICLVPLFIYLFQVCKNHLAALGVFLLAGVTDVVDGFLARRFNWISDTGKILDPFADKCMQIAAVICLGIGDFIAPWIATVLVLKEFVLLLGALLALKKEKVYVQSNWYGKVGTIAFYIVITLLVSVKSMPEVLRFCLGSSLILFMLFALAMYVINYRKNIMHSNGKLETK